MSNFKLLKGYVGKTDSNNDDSHQNGLFFPSFEPMIQNRFLVIFPEHLNIPSYLVKKTARPSATFNDRFEFRWDDINFILYDPITQSTSRRIYELIGAQLLYNPLVIKLQMLSPVGDIVSDWSIWGIFNSVDFGDLDYSSNEMADITLNMSVSNVILNY